MGLGRYAPLEDIERSFRACVTFVRACLLCGVVVALIAVGAAGADRAARAGAAGDGQEDPPHQALQDPHHAAPRHARPLPAGAYDITNPRLPPEL
jgi:hypothetical protein